MSFFNKPRLRRAFTLSELISVLVIIAILAAIILVGFDGFRGKAKLQVAKSNLGVIHRSLVQKATLGEELDYTLVGTVINQYPLVGSDDGLTTEMLVSTEADPNASTSIHQISTSLKLTGTPLSTGGVSTEDVLVTAVLVENTCVYVSTKGTSIKTWSTERYTRCAAIDGDEPEDPIVDPVLPGQPRSLAGSQAGRSTLKTHWLAPTSNGGAPITGYRVAEIINGVSHSTTTYELSDTTDALEVVDGRFEIRRSSLVTGYTYAYSVSAINVVGIGEPAGPSIAVTIYDVPAQPQDLVATAGDTEVGLSWNMQTYYSNAPIIGYRIYETISGIEQLVGVSDVTTYTKTGLQNGISRTYRAAAYSEGGESEHSLPASAMPRGAPASITGLQSSISGSTATLSWTRAVSVTGALVSDIIVKRGTTTVATLGPTITSYNAPGLTLGQSYDFSVTARNSDGSSAPADITVDMVTTPLTPTGLTATATSRKITLTWAANTSSPARPLTGYMISSYADGYYSFVTAATGTSITLDGLDNGTSYSYAIQAYNVEGPSSFTSVVSATPLAPPVPLEAPAAVIDLDVVTSATTAVVTWDLPEVDEQAPVTSITINRGGSTTTLAADATSYTYNSLDPETTYTFTVSTKNSGGSTPSTKAGTTQAGEPPVDPVAPQAPSNLSAVAGLKSVKLQWTVPSDATGRTGFTVYQKIGGIMQPVRATTLGSVTIKLLNAGQSYEFDVAAYGLGGESPRAGSVTSTPFDVPLAATDIAHGTVDDTSMLVTWVSPVASEFRPVSGVRVYVNGDQLDELAATAESYTVEGIGPGKTTVQIIAFNQYGAATAASTEVTITVNETYSKPAAPTNFNATSGVKLASTTWTASPNTSTAPRTGYIIYSTVNGIPVPVGATTTISKTIKNLVNGNEYSLSVSAYGKGGESARSASVNVTPYGRPGAVTGLVATLDDNDVELNWINPANTAASPVTFLRLSATGQSTIDLEPGVTTYSFNNLSRGATYTFTIEAHNGHGTGTSDNSSVTIIRVPDAPANLEASVEDGQTTLTWNAVASTTEAPVASYNIYKLINDLPQIYAVATTNSKVLPNLVNGTSYTFWVAAAGPVSEGERSEPVSVTPITSPAAPTNLVASAGPSTIGLTWTAPVSSAAAPVTSIFLYRDGTKVATLEPDATTYTSGVLVAGTSYEFSLKSKNAVGASAGTKTDVIARTLVSPATNLTATAHPSSVTLSWTAVSDDTASSVLGYRIYRLGGVTPQFIDAVAGTTFTHTGLTNAVTYTYEVAAYGPEGESARTAPASATPYAAPETVVNVIGTLGNQSLSLTWNPVESTTSAPVDAIRVLVNGVEVQRLSASATSSSPITGLSAGQTYTIGVQAINAAANGAAGEIDVLALTVPAAPSSFTATAGDEEVDLAWSAVSPSASAPVSGYMLYKVVNGSEVFLGATDTSTRTFTADSLTNGTAYTFVVAAYGSGGEGLRSAPATATPIGAPTIVTGLVATVSTGTVKLDWDGPPSTSGNPVTGYQINRLVNGVPQLVGSTASKTYTISSLPNGASYTFYVSAYSSLGDGPTASVVAELPEVVPSVILDKITPGDASFVVDFTPTISANQSVTGFRVYLNGSVVKSVGPSATSASVASADLPAGVTNGSVVEIKVSIYNDYGSSYSATRTHTIGQITTGTTPATGTTTFPNNDIFQTFGNGYQDVYPGSWVNPVSSGVVTATSTNKYSATANAGATDHSLLGTVNSWGAASGGPAYIQWDFGATRSVIPQGIMIRWVNASWDTYVEGSNDNSSWTALFKRDVTMVKDTTATETYQWTNNDAYRYIRIYKKSTPNTGWFNIYEVQLYGKVNMFPAPAQWTQTSYSNVTVPYASTAVQSGQYLYWAGGDLGTAARTRTNKTLRFDMASETFSYMADMPVASTVANTVLYNGKLYRLGGVDAAGVADTSLHIYDIASDTWRSIAGKGITRYGATANIVGSTLYVFGGRTPGTNASLATGYKIDLSQTDANLSWTQVANFPWANLLSDSIVQNGEIIAFSGYNTLNQSQQTTYKYSPTSNTWVQLSSPNNALVMRAIATLGDGRVALVGGMYTGDLYSAAVDIWNGANTSSGPLQWSGLQRYTTPRIGAGAGYYNGTLYIVGGVTSNPNYTPVNSFEKHSGL